MRTFPEELFKRVSLVGVVGAMTFALTGQLAAQSKDSSQKKPASGDRRQDTVYTNPYIEAQNRAQEPRISFNIKDSTIEFIIREIAGLAGVGIVYQHDEAALANRISVSVANVRVGEALALVLKGTNLKATLSSSNSTISVHRATEPKFTRPAEVLALDKDELSPSAKRIEVDTGFKRKGFDRAAIELLEGVVTTATGRQRETEVGAKIVSLNADSIAARSPIPSVTALLQGRVPGLTVQMSSGTPGDPGRIRIRNLGSIALYNDPIFVVDGIRVYSRQSDLRNLNGGGYMNMAEQKYTQYTTPSPLDQIEPSTIDRIEVLKGPSASALYGSDAANGVIVISTKRGKAGDTKWVLIGQRGIAKAPEDPFEAQYSPFGAGGNSAVLGSVAGGNPAIQYAYTVGRRVSTGILRLPEYEISRYAQRFGMAAPGWMTQPEKLTGWGGNGQVNIQVNRRLHLTLSNLMNFQNQEKSSMSNAMGGALAEIRRKTLGQSFVDGDPLLENYYGKVSSDQHNMMMSFQAIYNPIEWIPIFANFGLSRLMKKDANLVSRGFLLTSDSSGFYGGGEGTAIERSVGINTIIPFYDFFTLAVGMNAQHGKVSDMNGAFKNIPLGVTTPSSGDVVELTAPENSWRLVGLFVEPKISLSNQFYITPGIRIDNTALSQQKARYAAYPKLSVSWMVSDNKSYKYEEKIQTLRVRGAIGYGGVQSTAADYLDFYRSRLTGIANDQVGRTALADRTMVQERSVEIEGGFDAEMMDGRVGFDLTYYWKKRVNALLAPPLSSSVPKFGVISRGGDLQFSGLELGGHYEVVDNPKYGWMVSGSITRGTNKLLRLDPVPPTIFDIDQDAGYEMGAASPNYQGVVTSSVDVLKRKVNLSTTFNFTSGMLQRDIALEGQPGGITAMGFYYGPAQKVRALRLQSLSLSGRLPDRYAKLLRTNFVDLAIQGSNLWLSTNYTGLDPDVSAFTVGSSTFDLGQVPHPRVWQLKMMVGW